MSNINEKNQGPKWYVAHTYTGYENKVKDSIEKIVENRGLGHLIYDVKIPVETSVEVNDKGEEKIVETKIFPSYVLVKMTMNDESWHAIRGITGVTGFVGPGSRPSPLASPAPGVCPCTLSAPYPTHLCSLLCFSGSPPPVHPISYKIL